MLGFLYLVIALVRAAVRDRGELIAENVLLRQQLVVLTRPGRPRPRLRTRDKLLWVLARAIWRNWRRPLLLVRPETVVGWRRQGWRLVWSGRSRGHPGRPRLDSETRALIARMARENPAWGSERIRGELLKLGIAVSKRSVQRHRQRGPARPPGQAWRTFLANHVGQLRAADLSSGADADVWAVLGGADRPPPAAPDPASAPVGEPERPDLATADRSQATGAAIAHRDRRWRPDFRPPVQGLDRAGGPRGAAAAQMGIRVSASPCRASGPARRAGQDPPEHRPRAAAALRTPRARRVLRLRAPPPHAPPGASPATGHPSTGPIRMRPVVGDLHRSYERAA